VVLCTSLTFVDEETFRKANAYGRDKSTFGFVNGAFSTAQTLAVLHFGFMPWLWAQSGRLMTRYLGYGDEYEITRSCVFITLYSVIMAVSEFQAVAN